MGLEAIGTTAIMVTINPGALKNERGSLLPGRNKIIFWNSVSNSSDICKLFEIASTRGLLGDLVGDRAAKYFAPLKSDE